MSFFKKIEDIPTALERAPFLWRLIIALLSGITLSFSQAPYSFWFLIFPCFGIFYLLYLTSQNKKQTFLTAFVFGLGYSVSGLNWIGNALLVEGNEYAWAWPLAVIALPTLLSLFTALYATISHILFSNKKSWSGFLGFCALLSVSEWVRGHAFTGFPWNLYGYAWGDVLPIAQMASLVGPYGITLLTIFWGASFGFLLLGKKSQGNTLIFGLSFLMIAGFYSYGHLRLNNSKNEIYPNIKLHIVQPNIDQAEKWLPSKLAQNFEKHIELTNKKDSSKRHVVIWPETALPPGFIKNAAINERIYSVIDSNDVLLAGGLDVEYDEATGATQYHNALMAWTGLAPPQRVYSKSHLVPFGEYIPFQKYIPLKPVAQFSGFDKGIGPQSISVNEIPFFSPQICYEIIFPQRAAPPMRPDYILTITNDGWYGDSAGPYQHFAQARFRAIEQGLPVVRSANTGISGIIDPYGRVLNKTNLLEEDYISAGLPKKIDQTLYAQYGDLPYALLIFILISVSFISRRFY